MRGSKKSNTLVPIFLLSVATIMTTRDIHTAVDSCIDIIRLSPERWQEYKALRLQALVEVPQAFGLSYEEEKKRPDHIWKKRLEDAQKGEDTWIVFAQNQNGTLVGMVAAFADKLEKIKHRATVGSVFVKEEARGKGVARRLMEALL